MILNDESWHADTDAASGSACEPGAAPTGGVGDRAPRDAMVHMYMQSYLRCLYMIAQQSQTHTTT